MNIYESVGQFSVSQLLAEIHAGTTVLPDFQRDFVWNPAATRGLITSVINQHPAGSLLRVRDTTQPFNVRPFEGTPQNNGRHTFLVLDGQQRLTALYQSLYGAGDYRYYIDIARALGDPTFGDDEIVIAKKVIQRRNRRVEPVWESDLDRQAQDKLIPLSVFLSRHGGFFRWLADIRDKLPEGYEDLLRQMYEEHLTHLQSYTFPVVTLSDSVPAASLCTIFETLNLSGVRLTLFELMTARVRKFGINLREKWDVAVEKNPILSDYDVDPYAVVQALALLEHGSCKKSDVLRMSKEHIDQWWQAAVDQLVAACQMLRGDCGIVNRSWLPSPSMLGPMTAIMVEMAKARGPERGVRREKVLRWIWCAIFGRRYEAAANTRAEKDYREMVEWFGDGPPPETVELFRFDKELLFETYTKANPVYKGVVSLVLSCDPRAKDFHTRQIITLNMVTSGEVDDHHIFPRAYLAEFKGIVEKRRVDCVLNKTLIDRRTNRIISDRAPSDYLGELGSESQTDEILATHLIGVGPDSPLRRNEYDAFLEERADLILAAIENVTGSHQRSG